MIGRWFLLILAISSLLFIGCSPGPGPVEVSRRIAQHLQSPESTRAVGPPGPAALRVDLCIDASQSMAGYVSGGATTEFPGLIDRLQNSLGLDSIIRFGQPVSSPLMTLERLPISAAPRHSQFYTSLNNPDHELFEWMRRDTLGHTFLYLTDGVQSVATGASLAQSTKALRDLLEGGRSVAILCFRGQFYGRLWSEEYRRFLPDVEKGIRPFYVIAVAPSQPLMTQLLARVNTSLQVGGDTARAVLRFETSQIIDTLKARGGELIDDWNSYGHVHWIKPTSSAVLEAASHGAAIPILTSDLSWDADGGAVATLVPEATVESQAWDPNLHEFGKRTPFQGQVTFISKGRHRVLEITPTTTQCQVLTIRIVPRLAGLAPSVLEWSTDHDSDPTNLNRTYRFSWLVEQLTQAAVATYGNRDVAVVLLSR